MDRSQLGEHLVAWRTKEGLGQVALAKRLGISKSHLCDIEKGRKLLSAERALKFAKTLGIPPELMISWALQDSLSAQGLNFKLKLESTRDITH